MGILLGGNSVARADETVRRVATLRDAVDGRLLIGTAMTMDDLNNRPLMKLAGEQFACLTAGNEMKPDAVQNVKGRFTFDRADALVAFAHSQGMQMIGHTLCWHQQSPKWLFQDDKGNPLPREQALENLKNHIFTVTRHFKGKVKGWDVVNEAVNDGPRSDLRDTPARRAIGDDFILKAFEFAHQADPEAELYYNDYNIELDYKRDRAIRVIRQIKAAGLRIDGIGIQGHWMLESKMDEIERGIRALAAEGIPLMITELDIDVLPRKNAGSGADLNAVEREGLDPYKAGLPAEIEQKLAARYAEVFEMIARYPQIKRVTFWGVGDGNSWLNSFPVRGRTNYPLLFDRQLKAKPAWFSVMKVLESDRRSPSREPATSHSSK